MKPHPPIFLLKPRLLEWMQNYFWCLLQRLILTRVFSPSKGFVDCHRNARMGSLKATKHCWSLEPIQVHQARTEGSWERESSSCWSISQWGVWQPWKGFSLWGEGNDKQKETTHVQGLYPVTHSRTAKVLLLVSPLWVINVSLCHQTFTDYLQYEDSEVYWGHPIMQRSSLSHCGRWIRRRQQQLKTLCFRLLYLA